MFLRALVGGRSVGYRSCRSAFSKAIVAAVLVLGTSLTLACKMDGSGSIVKQRGAGEKMSFTFASTPLHEALSQIATEYKVKVDFTAPAGAEEPRLTGIFRGETAAKVLDLIAQKLKLEVVETSPQHYVVRTPKSV